ncbi:putative PHD type zinc finger protein with BAH domain-containing protein, partial [Tieghemiomyces parasiticus]
MTATATNRSAVPYDKDHIFLQNGVKIQVNDHVYLAPEANNEAFYVGRVMQFTRANPETPGTSDEATSSPMVRRTSRRKSAVPAPAATTSPENLFATIAWYQRPNDGTDGRSRGQNPRLVVATMHSDMNPVSTIRGKCVVTHTWHIPAVLQYYQKIWQRRATFKTQPAEAAVSSGTSTTRSPATAPVPTRRRSARPGKTHGPNSPSPLGNGGAAAAIAARGGDLGTLTAEEALTLYTSLPDHFYFHQLYDRFVGRNLDVLPVEKVRNVPDHIAQALRERYSYILVEPSKAAEYTDAHRSCRVCQKWCAPSESMRCEMCRHYYHMGCLDPPLAVKPGKGYAWQCVSCLKQLALARQPPTEDGGRLRTRNTPQPKPSSSGAGAAVATGDPPVEHSAASTTSTPVTSHLPDPLSPSPHPVADDGFGVAVDCLPPGPPVKAAGQWPFRYLGIHANLQDVIDYDDRIYPRAASRLGPRYQAVVPPLTGDGEISLPRPSPSDIASHADPDETASATGSVAADEAAPPTSRRSRRTTRKSSAQPTDEGGSESTRQAGASLVHRDLIDLDAHLFFAQPADLPDDELDSYVADCRASAPPSLQASLEVVDRALACLHAHLYQVGPALIAFRAQYKSLEDFGVAVWTEAEQSAFEAQVAKTGADMPPLHDAVGRDHKTRPQLVRHFYIWKGSKVGRTLYDRYIADHFKPSLKGMFWGQGEKGPVGTRLPAATPTAADSEATPADESDLDNQPLTPAHLLSHHSKWTGICDPEATVANLRDEGWIVASATHQRAHHPTCINCGSAQAERWKRVPAAAPPALRVYHNHARLPLTGGRADPDVLAPLTAEVTATLAESLAAHAPAISPAGPTGSRSNPGLELTPTLVSSHPSPLSSHPTVSNGLPLAAAMMSASGGGGFAVLPAPRRQRHQADRYLCDVCGYYWLKYCALPGVGEYERFLVTTTLFSPLAGAHLPPLLKQFGLDFDRLDGQLLDPLAMAPLTLFTSLYLIPPALREVRNLTVESTGRSAITRTGSRGPATPTTPSGTTGFTLNAPPHPRRRDGAHDSPLAGKTRGKRAPGEATVATPAKRTRRSRAKLGRDGDHEDEENSDERADVEVTKRAKPASKVVYQPTPCIVCLRPDLQDPDLVMCVDCGVSVHRACYGVPPSASSLASAPENPGSATKPTAWVCDPCVNVRQPYIATDYMCVLCCRPGHSPLLGLPRPFEALKRTVDNNWVHIWCALVGGPLHFGDRRTLAPVEGIGALPYTRWTHRCDLCPAPPPQTPSASSPPTPALSRSGSRHLPNDLAHGASSTPTKPASPRTDLNLRPKRSPAVTRTPTVEPPTPVARTIASLDECSVCVPCRVPSCPRFYHVSCAVRACLANPSAGSGEGIASTTCKIGLEAATTMRLPRLRPQPPPPAESPAPTTSKTLKTTTGKRGRGSEAATPTPGETAPPVVSWPGHWTPTGPSKVEIADLSAFFAADSHLNPVLYCPLHRDRAKNFIALSATDRKQQPVLPAYIQQARVSPGAGQGALLKSRSLVAELARYPPYNAIDRTELAPLTTDVVDTAGQTPNEPTLVPPSLALAMIAQHVDLQPPPATPKLARALGQEEYVWPAHAIPGLPTPPEDPAECECSHCHTHASPLWWRPADADQFVDIVARYHALQAKVGQSGEPAPPSATPDGEVTTTTAGEQDDIDRALSLALDGNVDLPADPLAVLVDVFTQV